MKTSHRQAARDKAARKYALFDPAQAGAESALRREAEKEAMSERAPWQATWVPLTPTAAPPRCAGADDYVRHPSRIGDEQRPYTLAAAAASKP